MRVAIVSYFLPFPLDAGGKTRLFNLLKEMSGRHDIRFIWLKSSSGEGIEAARSALPAVDFQEVVANPGFLKFPYYLFSLLGWGGSFVSRRVKISISRLCFDWQADKVQFEFSQSGKFLPPSMKESIMVVHELRWQRAARSSFKGVHILSVFKSWIIKKEEMSVLKRFKTLIAVSEKDQESLLGAFPGKSVEMIPNGVDTNFCLYRQPVFDAGASVFFVAWFGNTQNQEGLSFFADKIWPKLKNKPKVDIFGADLPMPLLERVKVLGWNYHGYVSESVLADMVKSSILVVPLLSGGGTRLKVLEAFSRGNPVVSTTIGVEGLDVVDGKEVLIADSEIDFADRVDELLVNKDLATSLSVNARHLVEERYDWGAIAKKNELIYE